MNTEFRRRYFAGSGYLEDGRDVKVILKSMLGKFVNRIRSGSKCIMTMSTVGVVTRESAGTACFRHFHTTDIRFLQGTVSTAEFV
jgi:hypothetical protein